MSEAKREKIRKFLNDKNMSEIVKEVLMGAFLKPKPQTDIQILAASRIAIDLLEEAWKELKKAGAFEEREVKELRNVGI